MHAIFVHWGGGVHGSKKTIGVPEGRHNCNASGSHHKATSHDAPSASWRVHRSAHGEAVGKNRKSPKGLQARHNGSPVRSRGAHGALRDKGWVSKRKKSSPHAVGPRAAKQERALDNIPIDTIFMLVRVLQTF